MNWFILFLSLVQLWYSPCTSQVQPNPTQVNEKLHNSTRDLSLRLTDLMDTNPWTNIISKSYYLALLSDDQITPFSKAVVHYALNNDLHLHNAQINMLEQGLKASQATPGELAANDTKLFQEFIADSNTFGLNYIQNYSDPLVGPIPDRIKQLPVRDDTVDFIRKLNHLGQSKKVVPILVSQLATIMIFEKIFHGIAKLDNYKRNPLLRLLTYKVDKIQNLILMFRISMAIDAHYKAGMTADEEKQAFDVFDDIWSAECRNQYNKAFVEQMGAYVRQPGDNTPILKQYIH